MGDEDTDLLLKEIDGDLSRIDELTKRAVLLKADDDKDKDKKTDDAAELRKRRGEVDNKRVDFQDADWQDLNPDEMLHKSVGEKFSLEVGPRHVVERFKAASDTLAVLGAVGKKHGVDARDTQFYKRSFLPLWKAMDTSTAGSGSEWVPTEFSDRLIRQVQTELKVAMALESQDMPRSPFTNPVENSIIEAFLLSESTGDSPANISARTPGTTNMTWTAVKLGALVRFSEEFDEDSIVAAQAYVRNALARAIGRGIETGVINGDTAATHQDTDVTAPTDRRKAFDGLRKHALTQTLTDLSTFSTDNLNALRAEMGKYGVNPMDLAMIVSLDTYLRQILSLDEVQTVDKYGPQASVLTGEVGKINGVPILVSEHMREDLGADGRFGATTQNLSGIIVFNRRQWFLGERRQITVKTWEDIRVDQTLLVATWRGDLQTPFASDAHAVFGHSVATS